MVQIVMTTNTRETVRIEYGTTRNANANAGGWLPVYSVNGRHCGSTWAARSYDKDKALAIAKAMAESEASKFIGDWDVSVEAGS